MSETRVCQNAYRKKLCNFYIPRRFQRGDAIDVRGFVDYLNDLISNRGLVMYDGLIVTKPLPLVIGKETYVPEYREIDCLNGTLRIPITLGESFEVQVEPEDNKGCPFPGVDEWGKDFPCPEPQEWGETQRKFFGLDNPYQMSEEADRFGWSYLCGYWDVLWLNEKERILGLLHSPGNDRCFHCDCKEAKVVYTSAARVVCMHCGATHLVLAEPLDSTPINGGISAEEFEIAFGKEGIFSNIDPSLSVIDFTELLDKKYLWMTWYWEQASSEALFFLNASDDEIEDFLSKSQMPLSMYLEMGWQKAPSRPSIASQLATKSISLDLEGNARLCLKTGLEAFVRSAIEEAAILEAILKVFQATELITKAALEKRDPNALKDRPNHPTVLSRLIGSGVALSTHDLTRIEELRKLRNSIQHGEPSLNYLKGIRSVREVVVFLQRFVQGQFDAWILDACEAPTRLRLLQIKELAQAADALLQEQKQLLPSIQSFEMCPLCMRIAITRLRPEEGATCLVCGHIPVRPNGESE